MANTLTFTIPAGTRESECSRCLAVVFWITTSKGRKMPVTCEADGCYGPSATEDGQGISHFADCPFADDFRSAR